MKILIVFYSLTGNTKKLAEAIAAAVGGEVLEIKTQKQFPKKGFLKYLAAGYQACRKELPKLRPFGKDPNEYDLIFLGTPTWAGNFVPAVGSFLKQAPLKNKKIALFSAHGGDNSGLVFRNLEKELVGSDIMGIIDFKMDGIAPARQEENLNKVADWARKIAR